MKNNTKYYLSNTASRVLLGEKVTEFKSTKLFSINIIEQSQIIKVIEYKLLNHSTEGNAIIHKWMNEIDELQSHLILEYNFESKTVVLQNIEKLQQLWKQSFKEKLKKMFSMKGSDTMIDETEKILYNKESFEKQFLGYTLFRAFFNNFNEQSLYKSELNLENYFGKLDLNLLVETETINNNSFKNTAQINESLFDKKNLNKIIREFTHTIDAKAELEIDMEEIYELDNEGYPQQVDLYLDTSIISGFYHVTNAHQVIQITEDEINKYTDTITGKDTDKRYTFLAE